MSCYQCSKKFSLFTKENGCGNCGFGFCSKCVLFKIAVPKKNNKVLNVCHKCNDHINNSKSTPDEQDKNAIYSPPKNFLKLCESNKTKTLPGTSTEDQLITQRLEKLQKETKPFKSAIPTEKELEERLNKLQQSSVTGHSLSHTSNLPKKQDLEQTSDDIIKRITEEINIEKQYGDFEKDEIEKLEKRLMSLQTASKPQNDQNKTYSDDVNAQNFDSTDELVRRLLVKAELAEKNKKIDEVDTWCCLCNDDAAFKCLDCDEDLFCTRCYKQTHNTKEYKQHRKASFDS